MTVSPLTPEQEAQAQQLAARLQTAAQDDMLALARLLVSTPDKDIFGATEFKVRDLVHRVGAKAFEVHLAEKKTATTGPASSAPPANRPPNSKATGKKHR